MVLKPGESSSDSVTDEHPKAEQWLFVVAGSGRAKVKAQQRKLTTGSLLLIPRNTPHQITNTGRTRLITLNIYAPPAYTSDGRVKRAVKGS